MVVGQEGGLKASSGMVYTLQTHVILIHSFKIFFSNSQNLMGSHLIFE